MFSIKTIHKDTHTQICMYVGKLSFRNNYRHYLCKNRSSTTVMRSEREIKSCQSAINTNGIVQLTRHHERNRNHSTITSLRAIEVTVEKLTAKS